MANQSASGQSPKQKTPDGLPAMDVLAKRAAVLLRSTPKQKKPNVLLTGFTQDWTAPEDPYGKDPRSRPFCHKNLGKGLLPRCRLLDKQFNDPAISTEVEDIFLPPNWVRPTQSQSHGDYKVQAIGDLIKVLNWWVAEKVDPEHLVFWFYAYANGACTRRSVALGGHIDNLITEFNYSNPATAAEIKQLWENLFKEARDWDDGARLIRGQQYWIDLRPSGYWYTLGAVKRAAAALLYKLRLIGSLVKEEQKAKASAGETAKPPKATPRNLLDWAGNSNMTLTIVNTDIIGSTALGEEIRDEAMYEVRRAHFAQSRKLIDQFKGREIKTIGDSFMAAFKCVESALDYARALQANTGHPQVEIRAGIHIGTMRVEEDDVFGGTVNFAARVVGAIKGAEIWLSEQAKNDIDQLGPARHKHLQWERHKGVAMKGFSRKFTLWSVKEVPG